MALSLVTGPAIEPVTLLEAKRQCRIDPEIPDEDDLITSLIRAAREHVENFTHRGLITQTWDWKLDEFSTDVLELPLAPVLSVTSISYVDTDGTTQTWSSTLYSTDLPSGPYAVRPRITTAYQQMFPATRDLMNAVTVRFVVGYGATAATVPDGIKHAIKLLVAHWYARREPVAVGLMAAEIPLTVESLLWSYKSF